MGLWEIYNMEKIIEKKLNDHEHRQYIILHARAESVIC